MEKVQGCLAAWKGEMDPQGVSEKFDGITRKFIWSGSCIQRRHFGGLGVRSLNKQNTTLLGKQVWDLLQGAPKLWVYFVRQKYGEDVTVTMLSRKGSFFLVSLCNVYEGLHKGFVWNIGSGESSFCLRPWLEGAPLRGRVPIIDIGNNNLRIQDVVDMEGQFVHSKVMSWLKEVKLYLHHNMPMVGYGIMRFLVSIPRRLAMHGCFRNMVTDWMFDNISVRFLDVHAVLGFLRTSITCSGNAQLVEEVWRLLNLKVVSLDRENRQVSAMGVVARIRTSKDTVERAYDGCVTVPYSQQWVKCTLASKEKI
ncbi:hypothetical protein VNO78_23260 [Psophocarpus tetragonolobus]|uniref:Reverse transcriptase n=1 Tax=Psophocarpus tetragonolobus TaxID=3891 RepID=A0AAN9S2Y0_PSOTE